MLFSLISFLGGFLASSLVDTSLGEFSEWAVVGSSILVATVEGFNTLYFQYKKSRKEATLTIDNSLSQAPGFTGRDRKKEKQISD